MKSCVCHHIILKRGLFIALKVFCGWESGEWEWHGWALGLGDLKLGWGLGGKGWDGIGFVHYWALFED